MNCQQILSIFFELPTECRRHERKRTNVPCSLLSAGHFHGRKGQMTDISIGGARIEFRYLQHFSRGEIVTICVNLPHLNKVRFVEAEVMWTNVDWTRPEPCTVGVRFVSKKS
jgi:hypothetical protein